jgi:hypothetical protein
LACGIVIDVAAGGPAGPLESDWLLSGDGYEARVVADADGKTLSIENGLVRRVLWLRPNGACVDFQNLMTGQTMLRAVRPEARVTVDGTPFNVGGLVGQPNHAFLRPSWLDQMTAEPGSFQLVGWETGEPDERLKWKRTRHHAPDVRWPPAGVSLRMDYRPAADGHVMVSVHYELYDGLPVMAKWITVTNDGDRAIEIDRFTSEILAVVEYGNDVETREGVALLPPDVLHLETDYAFGGFTPRNANRLAVHWRPDPQFTSQVNYRLQTPCLVEIEPQVGPAQVLEPGESFESFRVFELVHDSTDRERRGLALRRMYRTVAPWVTENPLILHVVSTDPKTVRKAIDQAAECGFEMVSLSFGSGLSMEDDAAGNLEKFRDLADYARQRRVHLGGYSLLASRRIQPDSDNCINPDTGQPGGQTFGFCPALASGWGRDYFRKLRRFFEETGFLQFTHDGSYPGDLDAAPRPPLQRGVDDSRWVQWRIITDFYKWLRARGVYLRVPDYYYLSGSNECGMGYREVNWSLPRDQQVLHTRQNIYDGTWEKTPSMGWMFVPLTQYHGGGAAATIEPLDEHLDHYDRMLTSNLALGVQAVYRGHRLYDTPRVRDLVRRRVDWYRQHRDILESDLVHGRRADGRDIDWMLHVNPRLETRGMLVVFNPLNEPVRRTIRVPLYYTGLAGTVTMRPEIGDTIKVTLDRHNTARVAVTVPSRGFTWYLFEP